MDIRLPPQNLDAEEELLAACMINPKILKELKSALRPSDFYSERNGHLYQGMQMMKGTFDLASFAETMHGVSLEFLASLPDRVSTTTRWQDLANQVIDLSIRRQMIQVVREAIDDIMDNENVKNVLTSLTSMADILEARLARKLK